MAVGQSALRGSAPIITLYTPQPQEYELALDEAQLEWTSPGKGKQSAASVAVGVSGAQLLRREGTRAVFALANVQTTNQLVAVVRSLEAANPGSEGELVLYDRATLRSDTTRRVLTKEVGVVLKDPTDPDGVLDQFAKTLPRAASGAPGGYLITADDPLSAVELADVLRQQSGVVTAAPLMRQAQYLR